MAKNDKQAPGRGKLDGGRGRIAAALRSRFALRIHTSILVLWTFSAGLLTTKGLLAVGVHSMFFRYTLAIVVAYGAFLLGVRIWLAYIGAGGGGGSNARQADSKGGSGDLPIFSTSGGGSSGGSSEVFGGGGGSSGGGGASASFDEVPGLQMNRLALNSSGASAPIDSGGSEGGFFSNAGGKVGDAVGDIGGGDDGCLIAFAIMILVGLVGLAIGGAFFVISMGPEVLIDAAFNAMLSGGLIQAGKRVTDPDWMGSVFKGTWIPLAVVLVAAWIFTASAAVLTPKAHTFAEVWRMVWTKLLEAI